MPILDLQMKARELGRIRIGQVVPTKSGKTRPSKLDRFRLTSASRPVLEQVAELYGGEVVAWTPQGGGAEQWEVVTTSTRLPILVPPQPLSQWYESWAAGGCKRRCDGVTEMLSDRPCLCGPDPFDRVCKPTTRLNVVLRDVPGVGVWRIETHGYYAAVELPQAAQLLAKAGAYIDGYLSLEPRRVKRETPEGKVETRDFMVPVLEIDVTPGELMAGNGTPGRAAVGQGSAPAIATSAAPAIEAAPVVVPDYAAEAEAATDVDGVREVWRRVDAAGHMTPELRAALTEIAGRHAPADPDAPTVPEGDPDVIWQQILTEAGKQGMSLPDLEDDFAQRSGTGVTAATASAAELAEYLQHLRGAA